MELSEFGLLAGDRDTYLGEDLFSEMLPRYLLLLSLF
jgi:hypothetical protein